MEDSRLARWDAWAWTETPTCSKVYQTTQHVTGTVSTPCLQTYRIFALCMMAMQIAWSLYFDLETYHHSELKYFTEWGKYMTTFTFVLLCLGHAWTNSQKLPLKEYQQQASTSENLGWWWKIVSWFFTMTLWWDVIITIVFWLFLLPTTDFGSDFEGHHWGEFKLLTDHIFPLFYMTIDWCLNGIGYQKQHFWVNIIFVTVYALINMTIVLSTGNVVYPGLTWTTWLSWLLVILGYPAGFGLWHFLVWCTDKKLLRMQKQRGELTQIVNSFEQEDREEYGLLDAGKVNNSERI